MRKHWVCLVFLGLLPWAVLRAENAPETIRSKVPGDKNSRSRSERPLEPAQDLAEAKLNLKAGEHGEGAELLVYDIRVNGLPAGKAHLEVKREEHPEKGPAVWVVSLETRSNRALSMLYDVRDKAKAWIDVSGGFSRFFSMDKSEGEMKTQEKVNFKYDIGGMEAAFERLRGDGQWRTYHIPLTGKVLDPLSAIYYLRSVPLAGVPINREKPFITIPICADRRIWNTAIYAVDREHEDVGTLQNRDCLVVEPRAEFRGLFERKGKMKVWLDAQTGIPLKLAVEIPIGSAEAVLSEYSNCPLPAQDAK